MYCNKRLVGCNNMFTIVDGSQDKVFGQVFAANELQDDIDLWIISHRKDIGTYPCIPYFLVRFHTARANVTDHHFTAGAAGNFFFVFC